ncbi:MAG: hypothetical protein MJ252_09490, partial [archaeon]|nr:hypothetical protein [archaeon]
KIKFQILSGFHLHLCCPKKEKISGIFIEVSLRTVESLREGVVLQQNKLQTNIINYNFLHPIWDSNKVTFDIYDTDLSFILVKVFSRKREHTLARAVIPVTAMKTGYRVLELYDKDCSKFDESYLIVKTSRIYS